MENLLKKLKKIDSETNWLKIMREVPKPEIQIQIRAEIGRAVQRIEKEMKS